jgi:hypothetical protein
VSVINRFGVFLNGEEEGVIIIHKVDGKG